MTLPLQTPFYADSTNQTEAVYTGNLPAQHQVTSAYQRGIDQIALQRSCHVRRSGMLAKDYSETEVIE